MSRDLQNADALHLAGLVSYQCRDYLEAVDKIAKAIELKADNASYYSNRGNALRELKRLDEALLSYDEAIRLQPNYAEALNNRGNVLSELKRFNEAIVSYNEAIRLKPDYATALNNRGNVLSEVKRLDEAILSYDEAIRLKPNHVSALNNRGNVLAELKRFDEAIVSYNEAIRLKPDYVVAFNSRGNVLAELKRFDEAIASYNEVIRLKPSYVSALINRGNALRELKRLGESISSFDEAIRLKPDYADAFNNRGNVLTELKRFDEAIVSYNEAIRLKPDCAGALSNRGNVLAELKRFDEAIVSYNEAIRLKPDSAEALSNRGAALLGLKRLDESISDFDEAIRLKPDYADAFYNRGIALRELKRFDEALLSYDEAIRLRPDYPFLPGTAVFLRCQICQWAGFEELVKNIMDGVWAVKQMSAPFPLLSLVDDPRMHLRATQQWLREKVSPSGALSSVIKRRRGKKIHIAYLSADYHDHATSHLMAELFESHDRDLFELTAISFGPDDTSAMRQRVAAAFDRFEDVRRTSDVDVARRCRQLGVDIAVDLKGFTRDHRLGILAERCAPIQVNWLGYPGTMAAPFIDYVVADRTLIAEPDLENYTEKVIWLPDTYQVNDRQRQIAEKNFTRAEFGLPESGFVFCCFNNNYKILPVTFDVWMRLLRRLPGSVLWLLEDNATAARNLRAEAIARGVDAYRLVFAKRLPLAQHLARHRVADLFIDTWPYNAHTTTSDALWAGLPVLTKTGRSFASRVAASLLNAIGLPELITQSEQDYEELAVALAQDSERLQALKTRLSINRLTYPLFDCKRFTKNLELAYYQVMERHWAGAEPDHLMVENVGEHTNENSKTKRSVALNSARLISEEIALLAPICQENVFLQLAIRAHQLGDLSQAEAICRDILSSDPQNADALHLAGLISYQCRDYMEAVDKIAKAIELKADNASYYSNRGNALRELKRLDEALLSYDEAIRLQPNYAEALNNRGNVLSELKRFNEAIVSYNEAIRLKPDYAAALNNRGNVLSEVKRLDEALLSYDEAIRLKPDYVVAFNSRGNVLAELKRFDEAIVSYNEAIRLKPDSAEALSNRGAALLGLKRLDESISDFDEAIRLKPNYADAFYNRGIALSDLKRFDDAISSYNEAIRLKPFYAKAFYNRSNVLAELKQLDEALASLDEAIRLKPDHVAALINRGNVLAGLKRFDEAICSYDKAILLQPDHADAFNNRGNALAELKRLEEAISSFEEAIRLRPHYPFLPGMALFLRGQICQWAGFKELVTNITDGIWADKSISASFPLLALVDDPRMHLRAAEQWLRGKESSLEALSSIIGMRRGKKIHIAYFSADFREHAVSHLIAELFEFHDRNRFELTAISFGPDNGSAMRRRIATAFDRFEDVRHLSDVDVARLCRTLGVDIAVDLMGFTRDSRPGILAERCAPIQINWLGYPGTMAAPFIDYVVADRTLITEADLENYTEKVIWLPDTYQVNDRQRQIAEKNFTRAECGLPESGFVFCCFNNNYKILPAAFDVWMRLLDRVPGSVLWLKEDNATVSRNLRTEAIARRIDADRLVFANRLPLLSQHLARHRVADLFIDTWPYNAHTTASDALWAGLPVLTKSGRSFASRVAASLLNAIGLPELITQSEQDYEELAVALAQDSERLQALKTRLSINRLTYPLFDCKRFTKNLESAYHQVMERHWAGVKPDHLEVESFQIDYGNKDYKKEGGSLPGSFNYQKMKGDSKTDRVACGSAMGLKNKIAVITPYYNESTEFLRQCHQSVLNQSVAADHFFIADGFPNDELIKWDVRHISLHRNHSDYGNTPRGVGSLLADIEGYDFISYLDADNWFYPNHLSSLLDLHNRTGADVCSSYRSIFSNRGVELPIQDSDEMLLRHIDTSCYFLYRTAFDALSVWLKMPKIISPICDRVFLAGLKYRNFKFAYTKGKTVAYRTLWKSHYLAANLEPPLNSKENVDKAVYNWLMTDAGEKETIEKLGFIPI